MKKLFAFFLVFALVFASTGISIPSTAESKQAEIVCAPAAQVNAAVLKSNTVKTETVRHKAAEKSDASIVDDIQTFGFAEAGKRTFINCVGTVIDTIINGVIELFPDVEHKTEDTYVNENFFAGTEAFLSEPAQGAVWRLGYSSESLVPDNVLTKNYYFGGYMFPLVPAESVADDQRVRVVCIDDNSGRGTAAFCVIDGVGLGNGDINQIRALLKEFAQENNIVSINVSCTHAHSCIDTQGLSGKFLISALTYAVFTKYDFLNGTVTSGRDPEFMNILYTKTAQAVKDAFNSLKEGKLYFKTCDISEYLGDKRDPQVFDPNINCLHFIPNDNSRETWIANLGSHPTCLDRTNTSISADYPYYMEKAVNELGNADFMFVQGAQGAITNQRGKFNTTGDMTGYEVLAAMGTEFGRIVVEEGTQETEIEPLLNIRHAEVFVPVTNPVLRLVIKAQLVNNVVVETAQGQKIVTEIGYLEFGTGHAAALLPGEVFPEIVWGGAFGAEDSWSGEDYNEPSIQQIIGNEKKVIAFGLVNDAAGYILPDNDYAHFIADSFGLSHYEELLSGGPGVASAITKVYAEMLDSIRY
ncbi:MAG: hypothetical protein GX824_07205 [Clostridiales bacterium]|nr:hypothetical protein [Clostridiales bacterium]